MDHSQGRQLHVARSQGARVGESLQHVTLGVRDSRGGGGGKAWLHRSAVRLHPLSRTVQVASGAGVLRSARPQQGTGTRRVSHACTHATRQARCAHDGRHLRPCDNGVRRTRGGTAMGKARAGRRRAPADGVSVALSERLVQYCAPKCGAVQRCVQRRATRARAECETRAVG